MKNASSTSLFIHLVPEGPRTGIFFSPFSQQPTFVSCLNLQPMKSRALDSHRSHFHFCQNHMSLVDFYKVLGNDWKVVLEAHLPVGVFSPASANSKKKKKNHDKSNPKN